MIRHRLIILVLAMLLLWASSGTARAGLPPDEGGEMVTFTVNVGGDQPDANPGDGICTWLPGLTLCTLRAAIDEANLAAAPVQIDFGLPHPATIQLTQGQLSIINDMTIQGDGMDQLFVVGHAANRVFNVVGTAGVKEPTVTIRDLTIQNGGAAGSQKGAGVRILSSTVLLAGVALEDNGGDAGCGGALYLNSTSTVTVRDSVARLNENTQGNGGAICNEGGVLAIEGSEISQNSAPESGGAGGAIYSTGGSLVIKDSLISQNEAGQSGGGLYVADSGLLVRDSEVSDNTAVLGGGIAGSNVEPLLIERSLFEENEATSGTGGGVRLVSGSNATIHESFFSNNKSDGNGGGVYSAGGLLTVTDSTFWLNRSYNALGGAIFATGVLDVENSTLSANWGQAGVLTIQGAATEGHLLHSTLVLNTSGNSGAAINVASGAQLTVENSIVAQNSAGIGNENCATSGGGTIIALGGNLDSDGSCPGFTLPNQDPQIFGLADNGGETLTHMLKPTSPALNAGSPAGCAAVGHRDQRDYSRDASCDLGAVERDGMPVEALYLPVVIRE